MKALSGSRRAGHGPGGGGAGGSGAGRGIVSVMLRNDAMSLSADATTVLLATTVPAVAVSLKFNSAAVVVTAVPPIINLSLTTSTSAPPAVSNLSSD